MNICTRLLGVLLMLVFSNVAFADEEIKDLYTRIKYFEVDFKVNDDASFVEKRSWTMQVLNQQALEDAKQYSFSYSTSIQKAEIIEAYTLKANGQKIEAPKDNFQVTINGGKDKNKAIFSDRTRMTVVFSNVEVGDSVVLTYNLIATEPIFPNQFSVTESYYKNVAYDALKIKIDAPVALGLKFEVRELKEEGNTVESGRQKLVWTWQNKKPVKSKREDYSVYNYDEDAGFSISSFKSYEEIAKAYGSRATPKAVPTERIKKLADEIAKDNNTPDEIAHSLYDWVATNISYAGNCVGLGAVVPHDIDFILDNRMGDCKDHATLLQALLAAKNIKSTQALVNASSAYRLQKIPVVSMVNHVINYIPSMNLFLDSTSSYTPYRMLPYSVQDKPALLIDDYKDNFKIPVEPIGSNEQILSSSLKITADGSATGSTEVKLKGNAAASTRYSMKGYSKDSEKDIVKNNFKGMGFEATGEFTGEDPKELLNTYQYSAKYQVKDLFKFAKTGAISIYPLFFNPSPVSHYFSDAYVDYETNTFDVACSSGKSSELFEYEFPKEINIISIPDNFEIANETLSYKATYLLKANRLIINRVFDDKTKGNICSPALMKANKEMIKKALENYQEQIVYKK